VARGLTQRVLATSRYLIILAVLGTFAMSAILQVAGVLRVIAILPAVIREAQSDGEAIKLLLVDAVGVIDIFLLGTVLFIVSAGLFQLFVDPSIELPGWLNVRTLEDLKAKLVGVIVVAVLVAFLGSAVEWHVGDGFDILAVGLAVAAVVIASTLAVRVFEQHNAGSHERG
jgi:uncharacterized membrane protein YqhA